MSKMAIIDCEKCKGCNYCVDVCPVEVITNTGKSNKKGYDYVEVDEVKCTGCGACYTVCPDCCVTIVEDEE